MNKYLLPGAALMGLVSGNARGATCTIDPGSPPCSFTNLTASTTHPAPAGSTNLGTFNPPLTPNMPPSPTGIGGIGGPVAFNVSSAGTLVMQVGPLLENGKPVGFAGDVYQAFVDGNSLGLTPGVPVGGTQFSSGTFTTPVPAGANTFDINDQILSYIGQISPYGPTTTDVPSSFSPDSLMVTLSELPSAVPEPTSLALLAAWLTGVALFWRRRKLG